MRTLIILVFMTTTLLLSAGILSAHEMIAQGKPGQHCFDVVQLQNGDYAWGHEDFSDLPPGATIVAYCLPCSVLPDATARHNCWGTHSHHTHDELEYGTCLPKHHAAPLLLCPAGDIWRVMFARSNDALNGPFTNDEEQQGVNPVSGKGWSISHTDNGILVMTAYADDKPYEYTVVSEDEYVIHRW